MSFCAKLIFNLTLTHLMNFCPEIGLKIKYFQELISFSNSALKIKHKEVISQFLWKFKFLAQYATKKLVAKFSMLFYYPWWPKLNEIWNNKMRRIGRSNECKCLLKNGRLFFWDTSLGNRKSAICVFSWFSNTQHGDMRWGLKHF